MLTYDKKGWVSWNGKLINHYIFDTKEQHDKTLVDLGGRCTRLEELGLPVNTRTVIQNWHWLENASQNDEHNMFFAHLVNIYTNKGCVLIEYSDHSVYNQAGQLIFPAWFPREIYNRDCLLVSDIINRLRYKSLNLGQSEWRQIQYITRSTLEKWLQLNHIHTRTTF